MGRLVLLVLSTVLAVALGEATMRALQPEWQLFYPPVCFRPDLFEQTAWGYRLHPSRALRFGGRRPGTRRQVVTSNAQGFRGARDLDAPDARPRVVVLGDSMVFGVGVGEAARLTDWLEGAEPGWRVDNLGMVGYGPDLMLRALEAVALEPPPAVVVLAIYSDDLRRLAPLYSGVGFAIPRYALVDGRLETVPYPALRPWERLRLGQGLLYLRWRYGDTAFPLTAAILDRWRALATARGFRPLLAFVPRARDGFDDRRRRRWLDAWATAANVPYVDLSDALQGVDAAQLYLPNDTHWNAEGHRRAAEALRPTLAAVLASRVDKTAAIGYGPPS